MARMNDFQAHQELCRQRNERTLADPRYKAWLEQYEAKKRREAMRNWVIAIITTMLLAAIIPTMVYVATSGQFTTLRAYTR